METLAAAPMHGRQQDVTNALQVVMRCSVVASSRPESLRRKVLEKQVAVARALVGCAGTVLCMCVFGRADAGMQDRAWVSSKI